MTMLNNERIINLSNIISKNLAFRDTADDLFSYINDLEESSIIIDFLNIQSITASFAHQYMINKEKNKKNIIERNIPNNITKMFELIENRRLKISKTAAKT